MRRSCLWLALAVLVCGVAAFGDAAQAAGTQVDVDGSLVGPALPSWWRVVGAALVGHDGKLYIRVDGEGNCRTEWRQECYAGPNGQVICHPVSQWVCDQSYALFLMPSSLRIDGKNVLFNDGARDLKIGVVKSFLIWKWISLEDGAHLQAGHGQARLVLETGRLAPPKAERVENFARLYGSDGKVGLLVSFRNTTNGSAREMVRAAGYRGEVAPVNTWQGQDPSRDTLGLLVTPSEGAALIARLQANPLVTGVKPHAE